LDTRPAGLRLMPAAPHRYRNGISSALLLIVAVVLAAVAIIELTTAAPPPSAEALTTGSSIQASYDRVAGPDSRPDAQNGCPPGFVIDFSGLPAGTILGEQYAAYGVHISAIGNGEHPQAAIVFDSNASGSNDPDLEVGIGNISILARDLEDENADGLVDFPDENNSGGAQIFSFDHAVHVGSFLFIDKDHGTPEHAIAYDASDDVIKSVEIPVGENGSVQTINVDADDVRRLEIVYRDSGGVTGIEISCPGAPTLTPTPSPTPRAQILTRTDAPTQTPAVLEVFMPPVLPIILPATGG
jgi:hypothetical protein